MLPKCLVSAFRTPFIRRNTWPLTISTVRFLSFLIRVSFVWVTLTLVIAKDEIFIVLCSIPPIRNKSGDESPTIKVSTTSAVRITSTAISCSNFGLVIHKILWWSLQTFVEIFTDFSSHFYKILPCCSQTFAMTFINFCAWFTNFCRRFYKLLQRCSQTFSVTFISFCCVVHKFLPSLLQTFAALFTNFLPWLS